MADDQKLTGVVPTATSVQDDILNRYGIDITPARKLNELFSKMDNSPTVIPLDEFMYYAPLFDPNVELSEEQHVRLSAEYLQRINIYQPVHVVESLENPKILRRFIRLFNSLRTLNDEESEILAAKNAILNQKSDRPDIRNKAFREYTDHFLRAQDNDELAENIAHAQVETREILDELYRHAAARMQQKSATEDVVAESPKNNADWSFEE